MLTITTANNPPPSPPPPAQPTITIRAPQLPSSESAFDFQLISSYNLQQCLRASGRTLPSPAKWKPGGPLRVQSKTLSHERQRGQPTGCPHPTIPTLDVATTTARPH